MNEKPICCYECASKIFKHKYKSQQTTVLYMLSWLFLITASHTLCINPNVHITYNGFRHFPSSQLTRCNEIYSIPQFIWITTLKGFFQESPPLSFKYIISCCKYQKCFHHISSVLKLIAEAIENYSSVLIRQEYEFTSNKR